MAISTAAAIGLGLAGVGSIVGSSASKKAANTAANAQTYASDQNARIAREIYGQNQRALSPFMRRGNAAGDQINALLGLGEATAAPQPTNALVASGRGRMPAGYGYGLDEGANYTPFAFPAPATQQTPQQAQNSAFDNFRNSTGYQFRLGEGMNALNSGYAGAGVIRSGAAMKGALKYGQDFASNEFGNYLGALGNQQGVGLSGASALAGVGQNFGNSLAQFNNDAASAKGNAALIAGQNNFGNTLGMIGGGLFGYGRG